MARCQPGGRFISIIIVVITLNRDIKRIVNIVKGRMLPSVKEIMTSNSL